MLGLKGTPCLSCTMVVILSFFSKRGTIRQSVLNVSGPFSWHGPCDDHDKFM